LKGFCVLAVIPNLFRDLGFDLGQVRFLKTHSGSGILYSQLYNGESIAAKAASKSMVLKKTVRNARFFVLSESRPADNAMLTKKD
jgi:hypothetical protein